MIAQDRAKLALQDCAEQARPGEIAAGFQRRDTGRRRRCRSGAGGRQTGASRCRTCPAAPLDRRADRRHRRHPADRRRQLCDQPVGDRHARRPLQHPGRFPGARAFRRRRQGRRAIVGDADRQSQQCLYRHGFGHRQPHRRKEPHPAGQGQDRQSGRFAARRHVVRHHHEISRATPIRPSARWRSCGARTAPMSGRSRTARPGGLPCALSSATPRPC